MALVTVSIDDTNTTLITYQGDWSLLVGSSRQWNSTVHSTLTPKSSATFRFRGYQVWIWGTIPAGSGSNLYGVSIDGSVPNITSRASNGSANFEDSFYASPLLRDTYHEIVVTNEGSNANGNTEFMLDRFEFATMDETPLFTTPGFTVITSSTASSSSGTSTPTHSADTSPTSGGKKTPVAAIAGAVIGVLVVVIAILCYLLWRKSRSRKNMVVDVTPNHRPVADQNTTTRNGNAPRNPLLPVPFQLDSKSIITPPSNYTLPTDPSSLSRERQMSQKSGYQNYQQNEGMLASTSSLIGGSPVPAASSLRTSSSNRDDQSRAASSSPNDGSSSSMYSPHSAQRQEAHQVSSPLRSLSEVVSAAGDHTEQPPPSYSRDATGSPSVLSYK